MNCQNVRTAIDAASPREPFSEAVTLHFAACQNCCDYAAQMTAFFALMNEVPRVQVPNDFDFRLRARLAQIKAEPAPRGGLSFFSEFWKQSFSWGQTASAMAAIALVVTVTTVYFFSSKPGINVPTNEVAVYKPASAETVPATPSPIVTSDGRGEIFIQPPASRDNKLAGVNTSGSFPRKVKAPSRVDSIGASSESVMDVAGASSNHLVLIDSGGKRQVREVREVSFGIQPAVAMADTSARLNPSQGIF